MPQLTSKYNLKVLHPNVAREWHQIKNKPLTPKDVTPGSHKKVWWQCSKKHEWETTVKERSRGSGCPECSGKKVGKDNNLYVKNPQLAKEWHKSKNKPLTPKDATTGSNEKVWWQCKKGHEWRALVSSRSNGRGCPNCHPSVSKIQIQIFCELQTVFNDIKLGEKIDQIECDIYLTKLKIAIEYDGVRWHKGNENRDNKKNALLNEKEITLFRIREQNLKKISMNF